MNERTLIEIIRKIVRQETVWLRHYYGKIVDVKDPLSKGRVKIICFDLGFDKPSIGLWCSARQKTSLTTPKIGDWVEIYFINGDRNMPAYIGEAIEMEGMLPKNYKKSAKSHVIFEDPENKTHILFDGDTNSMEIGNTNHQACARVNDTVQVDLTAVDIQLLALSLLSTGGFTPAGPPAPAGVPMPPITGGKITSGSTQIKVGNK